MSSSLRDSMPPGVGDIPPISSVWGTFLDPEIEREFVKENHAVSVQRYVRFSVTFIAKDEADERRVLGEIDKRLAGSKFEF